VAGAASDLTMVVSEDGPVTVVALSGQLDLHTAARLRKGYWNYSAVPDRGY
jgi:hypothetical protein